MFAVAALLASCSLPRDVTKADIDQSRTGLRGKPKAPKNVIGRDDIESLINVPVRTKSFVPLALEKSDPMPDIDIKDFNAVDVTVLELFRLLLADKKISVTTDGSINEKRISAINLSGKLQDVLESLSDTAGLFYVYKNGVLRLTRDRKFVMSLPPLGAATFENMAEVLAGMGAKKVSIDRNNRMVSFAVERHNFQNIANYLDNIRRNKVMIVYETHFIEVALTDNEAIGVQWNEFRYKTDGLSSGTVAETTTSLDNASFSGGAATGLTNALSLGLTYVSGDFEIDLVTDFLQTQGDVEILSKPVVTLLSGGHAEFAVSASQSYVSQVGSVVTDGGTTQVTVETDELETGLSIELDGDYLDETVYTDFEMNISEALPFTTVTAGSGPSATNLSLPNTTSRTMQTTVRSRPGDTILIAGINQTRDQKDSAGPPGWAGILPFLSYDNDATTRSELVIVMKPRVVTFLPVDDFENTVAKTYVGIPDQSALDPFLNAVGSTAREPIPAPQPAPQATLPVPSAQQQQPVKAPAPQSTQKQPLMLFKEIKD